MKVRFHCTQCGACCRDTKIPLTVAEAIQWLLRGDSVQLLCEGSPWPASLDREPRARHFKRRSFAATSGSMPTRVVAVLLANVVGPCANLLANNGCGIYEDRPLTCRIYPAEINPLIVFKRENKACPPEAWGRNPSGSVRSTYVRDEETLSAIQSSHDADEGEADIKRRLCFALNVVDTALVHEAALLYSPSAEALMSGLVSAMSADSPAAPPAQWRFVSDQAQSLASLACSGAVGVHVRDSEGSSFRHHGLRREAIFSF